MTNPPTTINKYINHIDVLQSMRVKVNRNLPTIVKCPMCKQRMFVSNDYTNGVWYYCASCTFSGDSVRLFARTHDIEDIQEAVAALLKSDIPVPGVKTGDVAEYVAGVNTGNAVEAYWNAACTRLRDMGRKQADLLHHYNLYTGYPPYGADILGFAVKDDVDTYHRVLGDDFTIKSTALAVSLQDQPRRHCGFYLMAKDSTKYVQLPSRPDITGLAFLDRLDAGAANVYATYNIPAALALHLRHSMSNNDALQMVAWCPNTIAPWNAVAATRIIFWAPYVTRNVIDNARAAQKNNTEVLIASEPVFTDDGTGNLNRSISDMGFVKFLSLMHASAEPLASVIHRYHTENKDDTNLLTTLTADEICQLRGVCTPVEQNKLDAELNRSVEGRTVQYARSVIMDKTDGWYSVTKLGVHRVTNVKLIVERILRFTHTDRSICVGRLRIDDMDIPFEADSKMVINQTAKWLERVVIEANKGILPYIQSRWRGRLWSIAIDMYPPNTAIVNEVVGWHAEQRCWLFPQFRICDTKLEVITLPDIEIADLPCKTLAGCTHVPTKVIRELLPDTHVNRVCWSSMVVIIHNLLAQVKNWNPYVLGFATDHSGKHTMIDWLRDALDLKTYTCGQLTSTKLQELSARYGVPAVIDVPAQKAAGVKHWIQSAFRFNMIIPVSKFIAETCTLHTGWAVITSDNTLKMDAINGAEQIVPAFLKWSCGNNHNVPKDNNSLRAVIAQVHAWLYEVYGVDRAAFDSLVNLLHYEGEDASITYAENMLMTLVWILGKELYRPTSRKHRLIYTNANGDTVLELSSIVSFIARAGYAMPPVGTVIGTLTESGIVAEVRDGLRNTVVIDKQVWAEYRQRVLATAQMRYSPEVCLQFDHASGVYLFPQPDQDIDGCSATKPVQQS